MAGLIVKSPYLKGGSGKGAGGYMKYIATRENVEKYAQYIAEHPRSHGLFSDENVVDLQKAMDGLQGYTGNVWTHILSLTRDDAVRLGYDHADPWRDLLRTHRNDIAAAMNIPPTHFRWYAAFHDEGDHPHVHMMAWSSVPGEAYLTRTGIQKIRSELTNDIFSSELVPIYEQKSETRQELVNEARHSLMELTQKMRAGCVNAPELELKMQTLSKKLKTAKGKHSYGYLSKDTKQLVDEIVDQVSAVPVVSECYDRWLEIQGRVDRFYSEKNGKRERLPLSQQKAFAAVKNAVIRTADELNRFSFEARTMNTEDEDTEFPAASPTYWRLRDQIEDRHLPLAERDEAVEEMKNLSTNGEPYAQFYMGRLYRDGGIVIPDEEQAEHFFRMAAEQDFSEAQYALGKMLVSQGNKEGIRWLERAADNGNDCAAYRLGKEYLRSGDREKAEAYFHQAAEQENPYAQYVLGKLCLEDGNTERGLAYMERAARNGHEYARLFLERQDNLREPNLMLAATKLLYRLGKVFQDNSLPQTGSSLRIDRKRWRQLQEKRMALGHRAEDHELDENEIGMTIQ